MHRGINWIEHTTGLSEPEWLSARGESIKVNFASGDEDPNPRFGPRLQVSGKGMAWNAGCFAVWPLSELETCAYGSETPSTETPATDGDDGDGPIVEIMFRSTERGLHGVEVSALQASVEASQGPHMFQVASNFNCLEVPSANGAPDEGDFCTELMLDHTQGPAAASGAAVSALIRAHAAFYNPETPADTWGQTIARQVN